ncbi:MAG: hypothetical protein Q9213_005611 [Squamulea squamosa]
MAPLCSVKLHVLTLAVKGSEKSMGQAAKRRTPGFTFPFYNITPKRILSSLKQNLQSLNHKDAHRSERRKQAIEKRLVALRDPSLGLKHCF